MIQKLLVNTVKKEIQILPILHIKEHGENVMKSLLKLQIKTIYTDVKQAI